MLEDLEESEAARPAPTTQRVTDPLRRERRQPVRRPLPDHLPREEIVHDPGSVCPGCGGTRFSKLGEDVTEILEKIPARLKVIRHIRPKLSCRCCERIMQAPMPDLPIEKGRPGPGLVANVVVSKYLDGLSLYRQSAILAREGIDIERASLADWVGHAAWRVTPLAELIGARVLAAPIIHTDDTPIVVLAPGNGKTRTGRLWAYVVDERPWQGERAPAAYYRLSPDRRGERPRDHLAGFRGTIQADAFSGYEAQCLVHAPVGYRARLSFPSYGECMAKRSGQAKRPAGKCIFCERGAFPGNPMTGEHLWSDWMTEAKLLPRGGEHEQVRMIVRGSARILVSEIRKTRQGEASTIKMRRVCKLCNTGWMGNIEENAKPILVPLIRGEKCFLNPTMTTTLMQWILMKVLVAECNSHPDHPVDPIFDQVTRTDFMHSRTIPPYVRAWIGMHIGTKWITGFHRHACGLGFTRTLPPPPPDPARAKNVQVITWGIGRFLIYLNATTDPAIYPVLDHNGPSPLWRFWPLGTGIAWPPPFFVSDAQIDELSEAMETFLTSGAVILTY